MVVQQTHPEREDSNRVKVIVSPVGRQGRPGTPGVSIRFFDTLQEALDLQPRPENGVTFQVREETDPENFGFYVFDDREPEGYRYLGERWDDEYLTQIENRIDAFEQDVEGQVQGLETRVDDVESDVAGFKAEVNQRVEDAENAVQSLQDTTARYAFDTLQEAQDKWASFSQEEKDALDGKTFFVKDENSEYRWNSTQTGGTDFVRKFTNPDYRFIDLEIDDISFTDGNVTVNKKLLLMNIKTGHRVYLLSNDDDFPYTFTIQSSSILALPIEVFENTPSVGTIPADALVELPYGSDTDNYIVLYLNLSSTPATSGGLFNEYIELANLRKKTKDISKKTIPTIELISGTDYTIEQGGVNAQGHFQVRPDRVSTTMIEAGDLRNVVVPDGVHFSVSYYDRHRRFLTQVPYGEETDLPLVNGSRFIRISFRYSDNSGISPDDIQGEEIHISYLKTIADEGSDQSNYKLLNVSSQDIEWNENSIVFHRNPLIYNILTGHRVYLLPDESLPYTFQRQPSTLLVLSESVFQDAGAVSRLPLGSIEEIPYGENTNGKIVLSINTNFSNVATGGVLDVLRAGGIPQGGSEGEVLTPEGWDGSFATTDYVGIKVDEINNEIDEAKSTISDLDSRVGLVESEKVSNSALNQTLIDYQKKTDPISLIVDEIVTPTKLSQSTIDLINTSGGGTVTNLADDEDIESVGGLLKLKGEGVVRFRLQNTSTENYEHLSELLSSGLPIQIKDSIDLANADGSIREINLNGQTLRFVGTGEVKNCLLTGSVSIEAGRRKIFENVYFHKWAIDGVEQVNKDGVYNMYLSDTNRDVINLRTNELFEADLSVPVNPFQIGATYYKIGNFFTPVLEGDKYVYKENGTTQLELDVVDGKIQLPITKEYVFTNAEGNVLQSTIDVKDDKKITWVTIEPENLRVSRVIFPELRKKLAINNRIFPEWFGAKIDDEYFDNKHAFQSMHLINGSFDLAPAIYHLSGDVVIYGGTVIHGNKATLRMMNNSSARCMYEIETRFQQDGITIYDLILKGNKSNNTTEQDGIYFDFLKGKAAPFQSYAVDNTYWYNLIIQDFTSCGIYGACPGTSHIYSSDIAGNGLDGVTWGYEHFTLTNCHAGRNGRHGVFAGGNHWRIIGGGYGHNGAGSNIHCIGAFEAQIIGVSCIHSGRFQLKDGGGYVASDLNVYGYVWVGEGNGTHELVGGNGIHMRNCRNITILGVRINNQNANGINVEGAASNITISNTQFNDNNMTRGEFKDLGGESMSNVTIDNSKIDGRYIVSNMDLSSFSNGDWSDLLGTFPDYGFGVLSFRDSGAANRPSDAGAHLAGSIRVARQSSGGREWGRTFIDAIDNAGNRFTRYVRIDFSTGEYSEDTGWISN